MSKNLPFEAEIDGQTVGELARSLGFRSFDTALPQSWVDMCADGTWSPQHPRYDVRGRFIVCYDDSSLGLVEPLTREAEEWFLRNA